MYILPYIWFGFVDCKNDISFRQTVRGKIVFYFNIFSGLIHKSVYMSKYMFDVAL